MGSSPLTRGALKARARSITRNGLIPAHAGSTAKDGQCPPRPGAHPRSRGEHLSCTPDLYSDDGSSPLTRGARFGKELVYFLGGLIPAHAGSTRPELETPSIQRAHPRSRGEHERRKIPAGRAWGSSPLTRGAPGLVTAVVEASRLIPAHAGSTSPLAGGGLFLRAHPPLTRGARIPRRVLRYACGLIPAHAGSTPFVRRGILQRWAHPRSRGEHSRGQPCCSSTRGSSPLTRGAPDNVGPCGAQEGLIPAHAGSTV